MKKNTWVQGVSSWHKNTRKVWPPVVSYLKGSNGEGESDFKPSSTGVVGFGSYI